eukprot:188926_1
MDCISPNHIKSISTTNSTNTNTKYIYKSISNTCEKLQILAESQPNVFISSINPIIECLTNVTKSSNLEWDTCRFSMNLLITLLEYNCNCNEIDLINISTKVIPLCFNFLSTFNANLEWNT